jgi:hypothetical protein
MKSLELFLCEKYLERKDGSPEGLYSREGDARVWACRVSDHKEEGTLIIPIHY